MSFLITGMPRSRMAWFAAYFTALGYPCKHEMLRDCSSEQDFVDQLVDYGNADCGLMYYPGLFSLGWPVVIIERGFTSQLDGLRIPFDQIDERIEEIVMHCTGAKPDEAITKLFLDMNIQAKEIKGPSTLWALSLIGGDQWLG